MRALGGPHEYLGAPKKPFSGGRRKQTDELLPALGKQLATKFDIPPGFPSRNLTMLKNVVSRAQHRALSLPPSYSDSRP